MSDMKPEDFARGFQQAARQTDCAGLREHAGGHLRPAAKGDVAYLTCYLTVSAVSVELTKECCCFPDAAELDHYFPRLQTWRGQARAAQDCNGRGKTTDKAALNIDL